MRALVLLAACAHAAPPPPLASTPAPAPVVVKSSGPRWIGVAMAPGTTKIENVFASSPAERAGLQPGDELVSVDGVAISDAVTLRQQIVVHPDGASIAFRRRGTQHVVRLVSAPMPSTDDLARTLIGKPAPTFSLTTLDGATLDLASLRGKPVLLDFWATWCRPCEVLHPQLEAFAAAHPDYAIVGISSEDPAAQRTYSRAHPSAYPLAVDPGGTIQLAYLADTLPRLVLIDERGVVKAMASGLNALAQLP